MRALLDAHDPVEKKMFGGLAFLVGGKMAIVASGQGGAMVRVDPDDAEGLCSLAGVERMVMRGRPMDGWLRLQGSVLDEDEALIAWIERGVAAAAAAG